MPSEFRSLLDNGIESNRLEHESTEPKPIVFKHLKLFPWNEANDSTLCGGPDSNSKEIPYPACPVCEAMLGSLLKANWHLCKECGRPYNCESTVCGPSRVGEQVGKCSDCLRFRGPVPCFSTPCSRSVKYLAFLNKHPRAELRYVCEYDADELITEYGAALVYLMPLTPRIPPVEDAKTIHLKIRHTGNPEDIAKADTACGLVDMDYMIFHALDKPEDLMAFLTRMSPPQYAGKRTVCQYCITTVSKRSTGHLPQGFVCTNCETLGHQLCFNTACTCCAGKNPFPGKTS